MNLYLLRKRGFDLSTHVPFTRYYNVQCSACQALVVNGMATHERGCPNDTRECEECGSFIPRPLRRCAECSS